MVVFPTPPNPFAKLLQVLSLHSHGFRDVDELRGKLLMLGSVVFSHATQAFLLARLRVADAVSDPALAHELRPALEICNLDGDAAPRGPRQELVEGIADGDQPASTPAIGTESVGEVVDAVLDVVGHVPDLLHPVLRLVVVALVALAEVGEEGLHARELVGDELDVAADAPDEGVLLGEEAAELAQ